MKPTTHKKKFIFKKEYLKAMQHDAKHWAGISFTLKHIEKILDNADQETVEWLWNDFDGCDYSNGGGMDTSPRDVWFSLIGYHYAGSDWPINADGETVSRKFFLDLKRGLDKDKVKYE